MVTPPFATRSVARSRAIASSNERGHGSIGESVSVIVTLRSKGGVATRRDSRRRRFEKLSSRKRVGSIIARNGMQQSGGGVLAAAQVASDRRA